MAVHVEPAVPHPEGGTRSRLRADSLDELHRFARSADIDRTGLHTHAVIDALSHFELDDAARDRVVRCGAAEFDWQDTRSWLARTIVEGARRALARPTPADVNRLRFIGHRATRSERLRRINISRCVEFDTASRRIGHRATRASRLVALLESA